MKPLRIGRFVGQFRVDHLFTAQSTNAFFERAVFAVVTLEQPFRLANFADSTRECRVSSAV